MVAPSYDDDELCDSQLAKVEGCGRHNPFFPRSAPRHLEREGKIVIVTSHPHGVGRARSKAARARCPATFQAFADEVRRLARISFVYRPISLRTLGEQLENILHLHRRCTGAGCQNNMVKAALCTLKRLCPERGPLDAF